MEKKNIQKHRRKYDEAFKAEVLKMIESGGNVAEISRKMGIGENLLYKWRAEQKTTQTPEQSLFKEEIEQLRLKLKQVEVERDILKKALLIFGRGM
jgi:transposase